MKNREMGPTFFWWNLRKEDSLDLSNKMEGG